MIVSKAVLPVVFLLAALNKVSSRPQPSVIRERHVIHAPIKFRVIHHYRIKKVPIIIKKHLHYHKTKPVLEEIHSNHVYHDDSNGYSPQFDFHQQDDGQEHSSHRGVYLKDDAQKGYSFHLDVHPEGHGYEPAANDHDSREEEDYEETEESRENYDDYE